MRNSRKISTGIISIITAFTVSQGLAGGLSTTFSEVVLDNLQPGSVYSMQKLFNMPFKIKNSSGTTTSIRIHCVLTDPAHLRKGHRSPSATDWIRIADTNFLNVKPGETVTSDIVISPPEKDVIPGEKYQVSILAETFTETTAASAVEFAIESFLRFSIAPVRTGMTQKDIDRMRINANYKVLPATLAITNLPMGINDSGKIPAGKIRIENTDSIQHEYSVKCLTPDEAGSIEKEDLSPYDPRWLYFDKNKVIIPPACGTNIRIWISIPPSGETGNKHYMFLISTALADSDNLLSRVFTRLYVTTHGD
jgi:hypothetical protein